MILFQHETIIQDKREDYPSPFKFATESRFLTYMTSRIDISVVPFTEYCGLVYCVLTPPIQSD